MMKTGNAHKTNTSNAFIQTQNPYLLLGARRLMAAYRKGQQRAALRMADAPRRDVQKALVVVVLVLLQALLLAGAEG